MRAAVLGAGAGGQGLAVALAGRGAEVTLCERSEALRATIAGGQVRFSGVLGEGVVRARVVDDPAAAAATADLVCVATTAAGQRWALEGAAAADVPGQAVVVLSGLMGSALWPRRRGAHLVGETSSFPVSARLIEGRCHVRRLFRPHVAALPASDTPRLAVALGEVLDVRPARSIVETCLRNPNPLVHAGTMLLNAAHTDREGLEAAVPLEGITPGGVRLIDALDAERRAIGAAYGYALPSVDGLYEELSGRQPPFRRPDAAAPQPLQPRFLVEDVPSGLALWGALAEAAGVDVPVMAAVLRLHGVLAPALLAEARTLAALGLPARTAAAVLAAVEGGTDGRP